MTINLSMSTTVMTKIRLITPLLTLMTFRHSLFFKILAILLFVTGFEKNWLPCTQQHARQIILNNHSHDKRVSMLWNTIDMF